MRNPPPGTTRKIKYSGVPHVDDPYAGVAIDYHCIEPPVYRGNEFDEFVKEMQGRLKGIEL
jgi:hypothetical protein